MYNNRRISVNRRLLLELNVIERKCDRLLSEIHEIRSEISRLPDHIGRLIDSLEGSAEEMYRQSVAQRHYLEENMGKLPRLFLSYKKHDDGF